MSALLDFVYGAADRQLRFTELYRYRPFVGYRDNQYPGNVVQYILMELTKVNTDEDCDDFTKDEWLEYKRTIFSKVCSLITDESIKTFTARDCATSLHRITRMLTTDLRRENISFSFIDTLIGALHQNRTRANPQDIANSLWSVAKLFEANKLSNINAAQVRELLDIMHRNRTSAEPQAIANSLWSVAKLVEANKLSDVNATQVSELLGALHQNRTHANPQHIANSLWSVAKLVEANKLSGINATQVSELLGVLHQSRTRANPQDIANSLWSVAKLVEANKLRDINATQVSELLGALHQNRTRAEPQAIANSLWSVAKLVEANKLRDINATQVSELLGALHQNRTRANPQEIANSLWSVAKLVEANKLSDVNATQVSEFLGALHQNRTRANPQHIANSLWSVAVINTDVDLQAIINDDVWEWLTSSAYALPFKNLLIAELQQVLMGLSLLGLEDKYNLAELISSCRPKSSLAPKQIKPFIDGAKSHELEAFVHGFFVDLLVTYPDGRKKIVEFDGVHHQQVMQQELDGFRDNILRSKGYEILRVNVGKLSENASTLYGADGANNNCKAAASGEVQKVSP